MDRLSWNEIQDRAVRFAKRWQGITDERSESQSFWTEFLDVYGIDRKRQGALFEYTRPRSLAAVAAMSISSGRANWSLSNNQPVDWDYILSSWAIIDGLMLTFTP